ncbi:DUF6193 family natural product biosynthesis protein [Streptomyces sp. NPDC057291]|uniref:DUF6193 family natural product biosynthesis protein n=1 Tax=Streptomyces sp. NPDC057291 TaxID=3346087 RepID=UPI0036388B89
MSCGDRAPLCGRCVNCFRSCAPASWPKHTNVAPLTQSPCHSEQSAIGEVDTVEEALSLAVSHLPAGLGPAVA